VSIHEQEKLTWSCLRESPFDLKGRFMHHLWDPNISLPFEHGDLDV